MRILIISTLLPPIIFCASAGFIHAYAEVDQRCVSVQTSTCNSTLARCQCTPSGQTSESENLAEQQRRCLQSCQDAYQKCVTDAARSCYR